MRLLWLADVLRAAGLTVHEYDGWRTRGLDTYGPVRGIICHGTAGSLTSTDEGELRVIATTGSNTAAAPIAELYLSRSGEWWVVASGTCTGVKTGTAGPLAGYSDDAVLQIEAQHSTAEPWTEVQYRSYVRGVAALVAHGGWPVSNVVGHYEHQPLEKTDPWFDMGKFRSDVAAVLAGDDMSWQENLTAGADGGGKSFTAGAWLIGTNIAAWNTFNRLGAFVAAEEARDAGTAAALKAISEAIAAGDGGNLEIAPILARIDQRTAEVRADVEQRHQVEMAALRAERDAEVAELRAALAARVGAAGS